MKTAIAILKSVSPYGQSKFIDPAESPKLDKESSSDYEARVWRCRMHVAADGHVFIPPMAFKNCLSECAKYLSLQIPGKGKATYTKHFEAGIMCVRPVVLPIKASDVPCERLFLPSTGVRGDGKRVIKYMPRIDSWNSAVEFLIVDETITEKVFEHVLEESGKFIGIGFFRPRNNGYWGRFSVESVKWS